MDVHQHTHTSSRKWTHYFWEFLMLFLAVFAGFLAENQREHFVERQRAKEYAKALLEDLAADTVELLDVIREDKIVLSCIDSIRTTINNRSQDNKVTGSFYYYCNIGTASPLVLWNSATMTQITQSGNLRYFKNQELIRKISAYYANSGYITGLHSSDTRFREKTMELRSRILNSKYYAAYSPHRITDWLQISDSTMRIRLPLQNADVDLLNEFVNSFENRRPNLRGLINRILPGALNDAKELMQLLRKEYDLK